MATLRASRLCTEALNFGATDGPKIDPAVNCKIVDSIDSWFVSKLRSRDTIRYRFANPSLLQEAILAAGASTSGGSISGGAEGNKRLALIGDALIRLYLVDRGYENGAKIGETSNLIERAASNKNLERIALKLGLDKLMVKNPRPEWENITSSCCPQ